VRVVVALVAGAVVLAAAGSASAEVELKSKATEIKLTGLVQTIFDHTTVEGEVGSEFLMRRVRFIGEVVLNENVSGKIQPDYGKGKLSLKDAYMKLRFGPSLQLRIGQFKRPFDLFELTSSSSILVIERTGEVRGAPEFISLSQLTEDLGYSERDVGAEVATQAADGRVALTASVTNGFGANAIVSDQEEAIGEKQFGGRFVVKPVEGLALAVAGSARPYAEFPSVPDSSVEYATAFQVDGEYGDFDSGLHVQAVVASGDNWAADRSSPPTFLAGQVIATYRAPLAGDGVLEAIEPVVRLGFADPNTDFASDGGTLITPGLQVFLTSRNKISLNVDVFLPEDQALDTEMSLKIQSQLYY
jgi:hypothetical protein